MEGKLSCPNKACGARLGSLKWTGAQCSCERRDRTWDRARRRSFPCAGLPAVRAARRCVSSKKDRPTGTLSLTLSLFGNQIASYLSFSRSFVPPCPPHSRLQQTEGGSWITPAIQFPRKNLDARTRVAAGPPPGTVVHPSLLVSNGATMAADSAGIASDGAVGGGGGGGSNAGAGACGVEVSGKQEEAGEEEMGLVAGDSSR